ncbi:hypothetical protein GMSM_15630 [Geomonas sp. Red276]
MDDLKFNGTGTDSSYLANINSFFPVLFALAIFKQGWPDEKLGSQSVLQSCIDLFREMFESGRSGNRFHIAARKTARKDLDLRIKKILRYMGVMAEESEIKLLLNTGVVTVKSQKRNRKAAKPAAIA